MGDVAMAVLAPLEEDNGDDFCSYVISQFSNSRDEHHLHVCAAIGAMSQELRDQNLPLTPTLYFGATCSSLDRLSSEHEPPGHLLDSLLAVLNHVVERVSPAILKSKYVYLSEILIRSLRAKGIGVNGIVAGLKVASRMLVVRENMSWEGASQLYCFIVSYITDDRAKVRKHSHLCVRDALENFRVAPALVTASEIIKNDFERRYLLLAGGSSPNAPKETKEAQEILYILDAFRVCLPYMAPKSLTTILKYFKSLLKLGNPLVTKRITDSLNTLCVHPRGELPPEILCDLLCFLANSITDQSSVDSMTLIARLLDAGMKRVYSLNRELCVLELHVIFNALKEILGSGHEEALVAAVTAFKSLIESCIDEKLINQGIENSTSSTGKYSPAVIERVCATIESLLDYHYEAVWNMSFQIVSAMFEKLGKYSSDLMKGTLINLARMEKLPDEDFAFRKQLHECIGMAVTAIGPDGFLHILPLNLDVQDLSVANLWLFPILKQYTVCSQLSFFTNAILPMADKMKVLSDKVKQEGKLQLSRSVDGIFYSLWSLLPSFCNYPVDVAESFKYLETELCTALEREPGLCGIVCSSLQTLIQQNKKVIDRKDNPAVEVSSLDKWGLAVYSEEVAHSNLCVLKSHADKLLHALSEAYINSSKDTGGILLETIGEFSSVSEKKVVSNLFKAKMVRLLKITPRTDSLSSKNSDLMQIDNVTDVASPSVERAKLFDLAASLLPGLNSKEIDLLFVAIKPALEDPDGMIQKRAYKVLSLIFQNSNDFISRSLEKLLKLMVEVLPSCQFPAKRFRLDCLFFLIIYVLKEGSDKNRLSITTSFLTEIILALKEVNKKARNRAYEILVQIGHAFEEEEDHKEKLFQFFNMVAGGLAGETPHMISAAVTGLARLAYEFSDLVSAAYNILPSTFLLLQRKNKEITKANLGLIKVLVAKSQVEGLQAHLRSMVEGLLKWQDSTRSHFKAKVKLLIEMLVKKCGIDAVKEVMPEEHMKLLSNIRKLQERKERAHSAQSVDGGSVLSKATTSRMSRWDHTKIFSEFQETETSGRKSKASSMVRSKRLGSKRTRTAAKGLQEESFERLDDEPLDLLDTQKTRSALRSTQPAKRRNDSDDDEPQIDSDGRMIIVDGSKGKKVTKKPREELPDTDTDGKSHVGSHLSAGSMRSGKRRKTSEAGGGWAYTGKEYASKKAGGDVKRKDKLEPYAYWPLDRKMLSRRPEHRAKARKGMASIAKMTKKLEGKTVANALSVGGVGLKKFKTKAGSRKK